MKLFLLYLPFLFSWLTGHLFLNWAFRHEKPPQGLLNLALSLGLGLGISSSLSFASFFFLNGFHPSFVIAAHIFLLFILGLHFLSSKKNHLLNGISTHDQIAFLILGLAMIPLWLQAKYFLFGGWDAWSVWNYKAKFLFLAGEDWRLIFAPELWRSSPHYPLFLPLINVWGWVFSAAPAPFTPFFVGLLFTYLVGVLLYASIKNLTNTLTGILAALLFLTLPFGAILATSQYCDIVVSFYLLASLFCFAKILNEPSRGYAILAGTFLGFLSFTKPEGTVITLLAALLYSLFWLQGIRQAPRQQIKVFSYFLASLALASVATILFQAFLSPGNQTYINGFLSPDKPVTMYRAKIVPVFLLVEFASTKWNGLWIFLGLGIILLGKRVWRREIRLVPMVLFLYLGIVLFYYLDNTYFRIEWWLTVTLNRILFSLLPIALFWIFSGLKKEPQNP